MHTLLLMRHAKSSWADASLADQERPLNERGKAAANRMGLFMREQGWTPDLVLVSNAKRARQTARRVMRAAKCDAPFVEHPRLYQNGPEAYFECIESSPNAARTLLVIGHNPDIEEVMSQMTGKFERMPTAAIALIQIDGEDWRDVRRRASCRLVAVYRPKELPRAD